MGFYHEYLLQRLSRVDPEITISLDDVRSRLLETITGHVLEIGFGSGRNLGFYPETITSLTIVDAEPCTGKRARQAIRRARFPVDTRQADPGSLPAKTSSYDCVVTTFVLCGIANIEDTLREAQRVLRPKGRLFIAEHGLSPDADVARRQQRVTSFDRLIGASCYLNRDYAACVERSGFKFVRLENYYLSNAPRRSGYIYEGVAVRL